MACSVVSRNRKSVDCFVPENVVVHEDAGVVHTAVQPYPKTYKAPYPVKEEVVP